MGPLGRIIFYEDVACFGKIAVDEKMQKLSTINKMGQLHVLGSFVRLILSKHIYVQLS